MLACRPRLLYSGAFARQGGLLKRSHDVWKCSDQNFRGLCLSSRIHVDFNSSLESSMGYFTLCTLQLSV